LGVNIDHVATVRQARRTVEPDPVWAAAEAQIGGASCITFHLRADRRHVNDRDAELLIRTVTCKSNLEMSLAGDIVDFAVAHRPDQATLVPENRQEITTEGGLDVAGDPDAVAAIVARLHEAGVIVSAFIDPDPEQVAASRQAGCDAVEFHTGAYANAWLDGGLAGERAVPEHIERLRRGVAKARAEGLVVHAGHGLTYDNVAPVARIGGFCEFNIGHSIISRSVFTGLREAVARMRAIIEEASR
jgi:pyridoxine 5-phosphate synthase